MKKILTTAIIIGMLAMGMSTYVSAEEKILSSALYGYEPPNLESTDNLGVLYEADDLALSSSKKEQTLEQIPTMNRQAVQLQKGASKQKFRGIWGYADDNETQGYVGGFIGRRGRFGYINGAWNTTDDDKQGRVFGILKKGFFNGKIVTENGTNRITGLYRIDKEKQVLHLRWMTAYKVGWAHCRINLD